jgi:hypothetical protein
MNDDVKEKVIKKIINLIDLKRMGKKEEVEEVIEFME